MAVAGSEFRRRRLHVLATIVIAALAIGVVLTVAAGARRTATAFPRLIEQHDGAHIVIPNFEFLDFAATFDAEQVRALPQVESFARARWGIFARGVWLAPLDTAYGRTINRWKVLQGRLARPGRADEAVASEDWALDNDVEVGDVLSFPGTREELANFGIEADPVASARVVGIVAGPGQFPPLSEDRPSVFLTPAFAEQVPPMIRERFGDVEAPLVFDGVHLTIHLRDGQERAFRAELDRLAQGKTVILESQRLADERSGRSAGLQAIALGLLALLAGIALVLVIAQLVLRQITVGSADHPVLRALGLGRSGLLALAMVRAGMILVPAALIGVGIAYASSGLFPLGFARTAEPEPGPVFDLLVLVGGATAIVAVCALLSLPAAMRAAGAGSRLTPAGGERKPPWLASVVARVTSAPSASGGVRLALDPGHGVRAVPVRSAIAGVMLSIAAVAASLTFGESLRALLDEPALYGRTFDMWVANDPEGFPARQHLAALRADPGVRAVAIGTPGDSVPVGGREIDLMTYDAVDPAVELRYLRGRAPSGNDEIALGARSAAILDVDIGDTVPVEMPGKRIEVELVGIAVVPPLTDRSGLGEGGVVHPRFFDTLGEGLGDGGAFLALRPGADPEAVLKRLQVATGIDSLYRDAFRAPTDVVNFARVEDLPLYLSAALALIAVATLTHTVLSAVRRRRRDIAIFKTLGLMRAQTGAMVLWQASTLIVIALVLGVPAGMAAGRALWLAFADRLGVVATAHVPVEQVALIAPVAVAIGWLVASMPARAAARTQPAAVLRTE